MPGKLYKKDIAIQKAGDHVRAATKSSVAMGKNEYSPDYSEKNSQKLFFTGKFVLLSQGKNHLSVYTPLNMQISTVYGREYSTFVCCDEATQLWYYRDLSPGRFPAPHLFGIRGIMGVSGPTTEAEWLAAKASGCTIQIHSHNLLVEMKKLMSDKPPVRKTTSWLPSPHDESLGRLYGMKVISVGDPISFDFDASTKPIIPIVGPNEIDPNE
ncbi:MAG: hypothetical protein K9N23_08320 [Akkermansiaceae bacterium]|nr:hypothetical protein [Akkermansiaceae bacterium]